MIDIDDIPPPGKFPKKSKSKPALDPIDDDAAGEDDEEGDDGEGEAKSAAEDFCMALGVPESRADEVLKALKALLPHVE